MNRTRLTIGPTWVRTVLPSGAVVYAEPQHDDAQAQTARDLGYGDDVAAMTRDHDPLHVALAKWLGLPASYSLRMAAGELPEAERWLAELEEAAVMAVQRFVRMAGIGIPKTSEETRP